MSYNVKTQAYSGPFDLLLQLVSRQKLDIGSISIAEVADQYMREVQSMGELDLDVASDFVLVAALVHIAVVELVAGKDDQVRMQSLRFRSDALDQPLSHDRADVQVGKLHDAVGPAALGL